MEAFEEYLGNTFGCMHCIHLEKTDKPINERKCTNDTAINPSKNYPKPGGVEVDKSWIRQNDIDRKIEGMQSKEKWRREYWEKEEMKDVNFYFVCDYFDDKK